MEGRGTLQGFYTGIAIALPSGIGVGLSLLGDNQASLVGVAISASLLPPAVNAGMLWALACLVPLMDADHLDQMDLFYKGCWSMTLTIGNPDCSSQL